MQVKYAMSADELLDLSSHVEWYESRRVSKIQSQTLGPRVISRKGSETSGKNPGSLEL